MTCLFLPVSAWSSGLRCLPHNARSLNGRRRETARHLHQKLRNMGSEVIISANSTSWCPASNLIAGGALGADLLLLQEHHLRAEAACGEEAWAKRSGWSTRLSLAVPSPGGGTSGGVGIGTPSFRGLAEIPAVDEANLEPGRVAFLHWSGVAKGGVFVGSIYLVTGAGIEAVNAGILARLAVELRLLRRPYIIGGDFQVAPEVLRDSGYLDLFDAEIVHPAAGQRHLSVVLRGLEHHLTIFLYQSA